MTKNKHRRGTVILSKQALEGVLARLTNADGNINLDDVKYDPENQTYILYITGIGEVVQEGSSPINSSDAIFSSSDALTILSKLGVELPWQN